MHQRADAVLLAAEFVEALRTASMSNSGDSRTVISALRQHERRDPVLVASTRLVVRRGPDLTA